jgi:hypothetical protein
MYFHSLARDARTELIIVLLALLAARWKFWIHPVARLERHLSRLASRPRLCLAVLFFSCIAIRLALLPLLPVPRPLYHDEFSYLFAADTFSAGRLTNPLPPVPTAFETIHINTGPTWQSMYLPGTGLALAAGEKLGLPWIAVLLLTAAFCASIYWMVSGWLPRRYGLAAAACAMLILYNGNWWFDNYFCLGLPALGGALVLGSLPRILRSRNFRSTALLGLGLVILMLTRPYEGALFSFPLVAVLLWSLRRRPWQAIAARAALVLAMVGSAFAWLCYYNERGTGHALLFPYMLNYRDYHITGPFLFSRVRPIPQYDVDTLARFYTKWELTQYRWASSHPLSFLATKIEVYYQYFLFGFGALLLLGLLTLLARTLHRRRRIGLLAAPLLAFAAFSVEILIMGWYPFPQYGAAAASLFFLLIAFGLYALRRIRLPHWNGVALSRGVAFAEIAIALSLFWKVWFFASVPPTPLNTSVERPRIEGILRREPGRQLCLVRYSADHIPREEWVFNQADLADADIVWARSLTPETDEKLIEAFPNRNVWLLRPDRDDADELTPYPETEQELARANLDSIAPGQ